MPVADVSAMSSVSIGADIVHRHLYQSPAHLDGRPWRQLLPEAFRNVLATTDITVEAQSYPKPIVPKPPEVILSVRQCTKVRLTG